MTPLIPPEPSGSTDACIAGAGGSTVAGTAIAVAVGVGIVSGVAVGCATGAGTEVGAAVGTGVGGAAGSDVRTVADVASLITESMGVAIAAAAGVGAGVAGESSVTSANASSFKAFLVSFSIHPSDNSCPALDGALHQTTFRLLPAPQRAAFRHLHSRH